MKIKFQIFIFFLSIFSAFAQFEKMEIETDSSHIEIIKNSVYKTYEEVYKFKNLKWFSVHFIKDTTKLKNQGWSKKNGKRIGVWKEYNFHGELMFTRDYDNATCLINKKLFPYHNLLEKMKKKADSLIISTYSKEFFENHVRFNFNSYAYDKDGYVGSWTEPMTRKPSQFLFRYQVKLNTSDWYSEMIGIKLDEKGKYILNEGIWNNYGFENIKTENRTFIIDKNKAIKIAISKGLDVKNSNKISEYLTWERFKKREFYNGKFKYYITELIDKKSNINEQKRSRTIYKYNVYSFNPWTGKFIEKKKMKRIREFGNKCGFTSGLLSDK